MKRGIRWMALLFLCHVGMGFGYGYLDVVHSTMPAKVIRVLVEEGMPIKAGDRLFELIVMKMIFDVRAKVDGVVGHINVVPNQTVQKDEIMLGIMPLVGINDKAEDVDMES